MAKDIFHSESEKLLKHSSTHVILIEKEFLEAVYSAISNNEAIVEEKDGKIAGMLMCSKKEKELTFLAVHPEYRKKGTAKRLIGKMILKICH